MGNVIDSTGDAQVVLQPVPTPVLLRDQSSPALGGHLDANGKNIVAVDDLQTKTINGQNTSILSLRLNVPFEGVAKIVGSTLTPAKAGEDFAGSNHTHDLASLSGLLPVSKIEGSGFSGMLKIDGGRFVAASAGADYAAASHEHPPTDISSPVPTRLGGLGKDVSVFNGLLKFTNGVASAASVGVDYAAAEHAHPLYERAMSRLQKDIDSIPRVEKYNDSELRGLLTALSSKVDNIKIPEPKQVQVSVAPIAAPSIVCDAEYLIFNSTPVEPVVRDATGATGSVNVTASNGQALVRPVFTNPPRQPLTYTFSPSVPPPVLCGIGTTNIK